MVIEWSKANILKMDSIQQIIISTYHISTVNQPFDQKSSDLSKGLKQIFRKLEFYDMLFAQTNAHSETVDHE